MATTTKKENTFVLAAHAIEETTTASSAASLEAKKTRYQELSFRSFNQDFFSPLNAVNALYACYEA